MDEKVKLYVVSHSPEDIQKIRQDDIYTPLFVGRCGNDNLSFVSDDSGDNISNKNKDYCELTGLYWMWKNSDSDIMGLCHYRRYFKNNGHILEKDEILTFLSHYDIILPKKIELIKGSIYETYKESYLLDVLDMTRVIIKDYSPEYLESFDEVMNGSSFSNFNMFVMDKKLLNEYCEWIFPILNKLELNINLKKLPRVLGLIAESIFNVWVLQNKLKVKELNVEYVGLALKIRMMLSNISFLRKIYKYYYFNFFKKSRGKKLEKFIQDIFYS